MTTHAIPARIMIPEERIQWTTALRSGKLKQGRRVLGNRLVNGEFRFCCLGVAAHTIDDIPVSGFGKQSFLFSEKSEDQNFNTYGLSNQLQKALACANDGSSSVEAIEQVFLDAGYNTTPVLYTEYSSGKSRATFESIADWIDENL